MKNQNLQNAIKVFNLSNQTYVEKDVKDIYRKLASANHPDKGGNTEVMQLINTSFEEFLKFFARNENLEVNSLGIEINFGFIDTLKKMSGVIIRREKMYFIWSTAARYERFCSQWLKYEGKGARFPALGKLKSKKYL